MFYKLFYLAGLRNRFNSVFVKADDSDVQQFQLSKCTINFVLQNSMMTVYVPGKQNFP